MSGAVCFHSIGHFFFLGSICSYPFPIFFLFDCLSLDFYEFFVDYFCYMLCIFPVCLLNFMYKIFIVEKLVNSL